MTAYAAQQTRKGDLAARQGGQPGAQGQPQDAHGPDRPGQDPAHARRTGLLTSGPDAGVTSARPQGR